MLTAVRDWVRGRIDAARGWAALIIVGVTGLVFTVLMWAQGQGAKTLTRESNRLALQSNQLSALRFCAAKVCTIDMVYWPMARYSLETRSLSQQPTSHTAMLSRLPLAWTTPWPLHGVGARMAHETAREVSTVSRSVVEHYHHL